MLGWTGGLPGGVWLLCGGTSLGGGIAWRGWGLWVMNGIGAPWGRGGPLRGRNALDPVLAFAADWDAGVVVFAARLFVSMPLVDFDLEGIELCNPNFPFLAGLPPAAAWCLDRANCAGIGKEDVHIQNGHSGTTIRSR